MSAAWDIQATTLDAARRAVWAEDDYEAGVEACLAQLAPLDPVFRRGGRVLEIGCGIGRLLIPLARRWPAVTLIGLDPSSAMLAWAMAEARRLDVDVDLRCGDARTLSLLPILDGFYSVVTLQHLPAAEQALYLTAAARAMRPGSVGRFQVVAEAESGPLSHPVPVAEVRRWCDDAGLLVDAVDPDPVFGCWAWFTVERQP